MGGPELPEKNGWSRIAREAIWYSTIEYLDVPTTQRLVLSAKYKLS